MSASVATSVGADLDFEPETRSINSSTRNSNAAVSPGQQDGDGVVDSFRPLVPSGPADWETQKEVIEDLYLNKNLVLNDVIDIMLSVHNFKATARMYKRQFVKWNWTKYNKASSNASSGTAQTSSQEEAVPDVESAPRGSKKPAQRSLSRPGDPKRTTQHRRSCRRTRVALHSARPRLVPTGLARLPYQNDDLFHLESTLSAYFSYISVWSEPTRPWRTGAGSTPASYVENSNSILQNFRAALDHFGRDEVASGGHVLRQAFLQIETAVSDNNVDAIWDCCLAVPQLMLNLQRKDLLLIFAKYLSQLTSIKLKGHPLSRIAKSIHALADADPEHLRSYITRAWKLWVDTLSHVRGRADAVTIHLKRGYVILMNAEEAITRSLIADFETMARQALAYYGEEQTTAMILELESLLVRMYIPLISDVATAKAQALMKGLLLRLEHKPENKGLPVSKWQYVDRYLSFSAYNFLAAIADFHGDFEQAYGLRQKILTSQKDGFWMQTALRLENYLRSENRGMEADEIKRQLQALSSSATMTYDPDPAGRKATC